jgi:uncharacterized protein (DUF3084 family)
MSRRSAIRSATPASLQRLYAPNATRPTAMDSRTVTERRRPFAEDFNMEHSVSAEVVGVWATGEAKADQRDDIQQVSIYRCSSAKTSPNCVYLG